MKLVFGLLLIVLVASSAFAQAHMPQMEAFGGYSFYHEGEINAHGWNGSFAGNFTPWFGVVTDISGHYFSQTGGTLGGAALPSGVKATLSTFNVLVGPQFSLRSEASAVTPFAHILFGGSHMGLGAIVSTGTAADVTVRESENGFTMALGGGFDLTASPHVAVRLMQADYFQVHVQGDTLNDVRLSAGLVFRIR